MIPEHRCTYMSLTSPLLSMKYKSLDKKKKRYITRTKIKEIDMQKKCGKRRNVAKEEMWQKKKCGKRRNVAKEGHTREKNKTGGRRGGRERNNQHYLCIQFLSCCCNLQVPISEKKPTQIHNKWTKTRTKQRKQAQSLWHWTLATHYINASNALTYHAMTAKV